MTMTFSDNHVADKPETTLADVVHELKAVRALLASQQAELLTGKQTARFLGISLASLYRLAASNEALKPVTIGRGSKRWKRTALAAYVASLKK